MVLCTILDSGMEGGVLELRGNQNEPDECIRDLSSRTSLCEMSICPGSRAHIPFSTIYVFGYPTEANATAIPSSSRPKNPPSLEAIGDNAMT